MATLKSCATGNWSSASTWALCNATAALDSEAGTSAPIESYSSSANFTPGAITVDGICLKISSRALSPSGTVSVELYNATLAASVAGTEVTINVADIGFGTAANKECQWYYFKFSSPVILLAATNYNVRVKASVASQIFIFTNGTAFNWSRQLVTTTTQAPVAGDLLIITGDKLSAGSSTSYTVTMDSTTNTDYGTGSTTLVSVWVGHNATLSYGTAAATNYLLRISGILGVGVGGTFNMGSVGVEIPRDSTAVLEFDCAADGDFGLFGYGGTVNLQGLSRTSGKNVTRCFLNTDEAIGQTVLGVNTDTGWKSGDVIVIASTSATSTQREERTLASDATATTLTVTAGLTFAHDGNANVAAEVILLTRNVMVRSVSTTAMAYVNFNDYCVVDLDYVDFRYVGSNSANKGGVIFNTINGSAAINNCIARNSEWLGFGVGASAANITFTDCDTYLVTGAGNVGGFFVIGNTTNSVTFNNCWAIGNSSYGFMLQSANMNLTNIRAVNNANGAYFNLGGSNQQLGTINGFYTRSNGTSGLLHSSYFPVIISNFTSRRQIYALNTVSGCTITFESPLCIGNNAGSFLLNGACDIICNNGVFAGETGYTSLRAINTSTSSSGTVVLNNCTSGVVSGVYTTHTQSFLLATAAGNCNIITNNCIVTEATEVLFTSLMFPHQQFFAFMNNDNVAGSHKAYFREGTITIDTTIFSGATPSQRMTPTSAIEKFYSGEFTVAVSSGQTLTPSVKVRESVVGDGTDYNGARARLIVKANAALGINTDTVLATATSASEGAWETLTGTTATATTNGVLKFIVDCSGTTGWINIDDWECSTTNDTMTQSFWDNGVPTVYGDNSAGGGGSTANYYMAIL